MNTLNPLFLRKQNTQVLGGGGNKSPWNAPAKVRKYFIGERVKRNPIMREREKLSRAEVIKMLVLLTELQAN